jgi:hypothetical protein
MATDLVVSIESIGTSGSSGRVYYFAKGDAPSWDTDQAWVPGALQGYPGEISASIDFFNGISSIGGLAIQLQAQATTQQGATVASLLYQNALVSVGEITADITSPTATTIQTDTDLLENTTVVIGREVIHLGTLAGAGTGRYQSCTRGLLETAADTHSAAVDAFVQIYRADAGPVLRWRKITLYRVDLDDATSYADLDQLWSGVLVDVSAPQPNLLRVDADGLLSAVAGATILDRLFRTSVADTPGHVFQRDGTNVIGSHQDLLMMVDGECVINTGLSIVAGLAEDTLEIRISDQDIYRTLDTSTRQQALPSEPKEAWQVLHCSAQRGADTTTLPLSRNLLTLLLQVLTTSSTGQNGSHDLGIAQLGLAVPVALVDVATITRIRDELGSLLDTDLLLLGREGKPEKVVQTLASILVAFGVAIIDSAGQISVALLVDQDPDAPTLTEADDILGPTSVPPHEPPQQTRRLDLTVDKITARFNAVPGHTVTEDQFVNVRRRQVQAYGDNSGLDLDLHVFKSRTKVAIIVAPLLQRFNESIPQITCTALRTSANLQLGSLARVTHSKIYQAIGGARGVTNQAMLVIERALDVATNTITFRLQDVGAIYARSGDIAPAAVVESGASGTTIPVAADLADGGFQSGDLTSAPLDVSVFKVGDKIQHCDGNGTFVQNLEVATISTSPAQIITTATPSPLPAAGDVIRLADYDTSTTTNQDAFAWLADSNGTLGAGNDTGKEYSF